MHRKILFSLILSFFLLGSSHRAECADDPFAAGIRPTEARSPEEEQKAFHLPPGFKIELFAAEPQIQKPINMAFDARGRLWVSCTVEYPFAAPENKPARDSIRVLEDTKHAGRADKMTVFADGLNIPIGLYPYKNGVIAYSIPSIYYFEDSDGDGRADKKQLLYGPFDHLHDTHGMQNAFRRGFDGFVYANHGFANHSKVRGKDGSNIDIQSGNTYRFRPDGSHIEQFTHGQVNPFGMTFDPRGDIFNSDCHTKPIMLLLRNGYYDSFGKPHNGLGYVPQVMQHGHGSTAIDAAVMITGHNFPPAYQGNILTGNVMTSRINRDSLKYTGSSVQAVEEPDFITCDDPWFRPVDMQMGPDGALYIADFYNKIIGHYEVPLTHPGRDRERGRIWRVSYAGTTQAPGKLDSALDLTKADAAGLVACLAYPNLGVAMRAGDELVDRLGSQAVPALRQAVRGHQEARARAYAAWALYRLNSLQPDELLELSKDKDPLPRIHAMRIASETATWTPEVEERVRALLKDKDSLVQRAAVDALSTHPGLANIDPLVELWRKSPAEDVHLRHNIKLALLEGIRPDGVLTQWSAKHGDRAAADLLAEICLALPKEEAGSYLLHYLEGAAVDPVKTRQFMTHAAKYLPKDFNPERLVALARRVIPQDPDLQYDILLGIRNGFQQRGQADPEVLRTWGATLARAMLDSVDPAALAWTSTTQDGKPAAAWGLETRRSKDGTSAQFLSSLPLGERFTGILRSVDFVIPEQLTFYLCGHLGPPDEPARPRNLVRLRLADGGKVIARAEAPRNDVAQQVRWDLKDHAGKKGYLEVVDGINLRSYAWLAVARFDPPVVAIPKMSPELATRRLRSASNLAGVFLLRDLDSNLRDMARNQKLDAGARQAAAKALTALHPNPAGSALADISADSSLAPELQAAVFAALAEDKPADMEKLLARVARSIPQRLQATLAGTLAESKPGATLLLAAVERGDLTPQVLRVASVKDKLMATHLDKIDERLKALTDGLPTVERELARLIDARRAGYRRTTASSTRGKEVFVKNCQQCHQIAGQGSVIGPQLDGIGERGLERLLEDVLDPNRNVDPTFKTTTYVLRDGKIVSGLFRRQEGKNTVIADSTGKEISFEQAAVEEQRKSANSLMPSNVGNTMAEGEFYDLMAYLLGQRTARPK